MHVELDSDFYWTISRMKNFDRNNLLVWLDVLLKYDGKNWSESRLDIMKDLIDLQYTIVKDLKGKNEKLLDKRFQSHVSFMFALGLGYIDQKGIFHISDIAKILAERKNIEEFVLIQMLRWQMPNGSIRVKKKLIKWVKEGRCVKPFILTIRVLLSLYERSRFEAYLTNAEIIRFLMPLKSHTGDIDEVVENIISYRKSGKELRLSRHEKERVNEDLKILLSYFEATGLCYIPKTLIVKFGKNAKHLRGVIALSLDKIDLARELIKKHYSCFDFSKFNLDTQFQQAKKEWFQYYGSIPEDWKEKAKVSDIRRKGDEPLAMPSKKAIKYAIEKIREDLLIENSTITQIISNLVSGKNVIISGPIGTGKTHLAKLIPPLVWEEVDGYYPEVVTATADWTTHEVIGGIYPKLNEEKKVVYEIQRGCVYDTVLRNWHKEGNLFYRVSFSVGNKKYKGVWLIIDEFNRANIDRAFGEMFTAIEHRLLRVPTNKSGVDFELIPIPKDYRIIATLNTFDKHYLFKLSDALKRRFAFVDLSPPHRSKAELEKYYILKRSMDDLSVKPEITRKIFLNKEKKSIDRVKSDPKLLSILDAFYEIMAFIRLTKPLGTALLIAVFKYVLVDSEVNDDLEKSLDIALKSNITPQLENIKKISLQAIKEFSCGDIVRFLRSADPNRVDFKEYEQELLKLLRYLRKNKIQGRLERYRRKEIDDSEWASFNPWENKYRPKLPLFRDSLSEFLLELEMI